MRRTTILIAVLGTALSLCWLTSASAQAATEGPFFKVEGKRLTGSETRSVIGSTKESVVLENPTSGIQLTCRWTWLRGHLLENGFLDFGGLSWGGGGRCTVSGNGSSCAVENERFESSPVKLTLGYSTASRTGPILVLVKPESGTAFATIKFTGTCNITQTSLTGTLVGATFIGGKAVEVGSNEVEAVNGEVQFGKSNKSIFIESGGTLTTVKGGLAMFGTASTLSGVQGIEVEGGQKWGIFT